MWDTSIRIHGEPWQGRDLLLRMAKRERDLYNVLRVFPRGRPDRNEFPRRSSGLARISTVRGTRRNRARARAPWRNPWRLRNNRKIDAERDSSTLTTRRASRWERAYRLICRGISVHLGEKSAELLGSQYDFKHRGEFIYKESRRDFDPGGKLYKANYANACLTRQDFVKSQVSLFFHFISKI